MSTSASASYSAPSSSPASYTKVAVAMHWLIALLIFLNVSVGIYMESFPKNTPGRDAALFYHASIGSLIFMLAVFRLFWRATHKPPALPANIPSWQQMAAHTLHWVLYSLMLLVPLTGYMHRMAGGHPVSFFGLGYLPVLIGKDEPLRLLTDTLHVCLVWVLCILVVGHIGAALKHRFIDRDGVIQRMLRV
ncbi:cytochrome b [Dyella tabacisoli]|uniref:Cytochrome b n=1 Tax=Dyella tabacisoli TaxID=2282381 RepID=A0A369UP90_9GAMM|nr:cytochrome b [Dyella tabacisoli]RDD81538.1 cytochrome b [Dyella tabacisoli]